MDALRVQARNALLEGAQSGKLMEAGKSAIPIWFKEFLAELLQWWNVALDIIAADSRSVF